MSRRHCLAIAWCPQIISNVSNTLVSSVYSRTHRTGASGLLKFCQRLTPFNSLSVKEIALTRDSVVDLLVWQGSPKGEFLEPVHSAVTYRGI